jgi:hypothetical protein
MKKTKANRIGTIVIVIGIMTIALGLTLHDYDSIETTKSKSSSSITKRIKNNAIDHELVISTKDEVLEAIKSLYDNNISISFDYEEDDCWFYKSSDSYTYEYCQNNPEIKIIDNSVS